MSYIPALRYESLTRFYDPVLRATLKEDRFKRLLVEQAALRPGHRVLDVGCGTATLIILLKQTCAEAEVNGLDGDLKVLALARTKIETAGLDIGLTQGLAWEAPFPPASFDRIVSSLVFHHLTKRLPASMWRSRRRSEHWHASAVTSRARARRSTRC